MASKQLEAQDALNTLDDRARIRNLEGHVQAFDAQLSQLAAKNFELSARIVGLECSVQRLQAQSAIAAASD